MATTASPVSNRKIAGGSFLIEETNPSETFTPEDFSEEHRQIIKTAEDFANNEILPEIEKIEAKQFDVTRGLLKKLSDLGLTSTDVPEEFGGTEMDKVASCIIADRISKCGSFSTAFGAHVGIGTFPIVW